jgi:hypothetical protein
MAAKKITGYAIVTDNDGDIYTVKLYGSASTFLAQAEEGARAFTDTFVSIEVYNENGRLNVGQRSDTVVWGN